MKAYWIIPNRRIRFRSRFGASGFFASLAHCTGPQFKSMDYFEGAYDADIDRPASTFRFHSRVNSWWRYYTLAVGQGSFDPPTREITVEWTMEFPVFTLLRDILLTFVLAWVAASLLPSSSPALEDWPVILFLLLMPLQVFGVTHLYFYFDTREAEKFIRFVARFPAPTSPNSM